MPGWAIRLMLGVAGALLQMILKHLVEKRIFDRALEIAQMHVARLQGDTSLDNAAKRAAAMTALKDDLLRSGITIKDSIAALAVELAVGALKAKT